MGTYIHGQCSGTSCPKSTDTHKKYACRLVEFTRGRELTRFQLCLLRRFLIRLPSTIPTLDLRPPQTRFRTHLSHHLAGHPHPPLCNHHQPTAEHPVLNSFPHPHYRQSPLGRHIQRSTPQIRLELSPPLERACTRSISISLKVVVNHGDVPGAI